MLWHFVRLFFSSLGKGKPTNCRLGGEETEKGTLPPSNIMHLVEVPLCLLPGKCQPIHINKEIIFNGLKKEIQAVWIRVQNSCFDLLVQILLRFSTTEWSKEAMNWCFVIVQRVLLEVSRPHMDWHFHVLLSPLLIFFWGGGAGEDVRIRSSCNCSTLLHTTTFYSSLTHLRIITFSIILS